jgi:hypothetical protein
VSPINGIALNLLFIIASPENAMPGKFTDVVKYTVLGILSN